MSSFDAIVFILHYGIFALAAIFFFLGFHKRPKLKIVLYLTAALWIIFGIIDFFIGLGRLIEFFG